MIIEISSKILILFFIVLILAFIAGYIEYTAKYFAQFGDISIFGKYNFKRQFSDFIKFLLKKEGFTNRTQYLLDGIRPIFSIVFAFIPLAALPVCSPFYLEGKKFFPEIYQPVFPVFFVYFATLLGICMLLLIGHPSKSKYSLLASLKSLDKFISFEIALLLSLLSILITLGTQNFHQIIEKQSGYILPYLPSWGVFYQPIGALIFFAVILIKNSSMESDNFLVARYDEYHSLKYLFLIFSEKIYFFIFLYLGVSFYFGGYDLLPGLYYFAASFPSSLFFLQVLSLFIKFIFILFLITWIRLSLLRANFKIFIESGWYYLIPIAFINFVITILYVHFKGSL